ncbi:ABC transporter permease [Parvibaculaceae bacterium PLY_AMNH_Bact1]|nr:ABC transporter permease [Parvibaculaceae bacterium PLY_AMNH_Bact1]
MATENAALVFDDLYRSVAHRRLWLALGWRDIRARYRRTVLGPLWTSMSAAVLIFALGAVYSILWGVDITDFLPYFSAGYLSWQFILLVTNEGCQALTTNQDVIKSLRLPYGVHILRLLWRNVLVFAHGLVVHLIVLLALTDGLQWINFLFFAGLFLALVNGFWIALLLSIVCARFRDVMQVVASIMQVMFFITPIFWPAERVASEPIAEFILVKINPLFHLIDVMRQPLIGQVAGSESYIYLSVSAVLGIAAVTLFTGRFYRRLAYWV